MRLFSETIILAVLTLSLFSPLPPSLQDVRPEDSAWSVIERTCVAMEQPAERRMYLRLEDGTELGDDDVIGEYIKR